MPIRKICGILKENVIYWKSTKILGSIPVSVKDLKPEEKEKRENESKEITFRKDAID